MINLLHEFLSETAGNNPNKAAVLFNGTTLTYAALDERSDKIADYLHHLQVSKGERVAILTGNRIETMIAFWGVLKAGAVAIPMGIELKSDKINYVLKDSGASVLFTTAEIIKEREIDTDNSRLKAIVLTDEMVADQKGNLELFSNLLSKACVPEKEVYTNVLSVDLSTIIYTSGSTGEPKGVMLTHQNMVAATDSLNTYLGYTEADRILCSLPLSFDYGLYQMIMAVSKGATLILHTESTWPIFLIKSILKDKATVFPAVPTMVMMLFEQSKKKKPDLSGIRMVTNTGAALTATNIEMIKSMFPKAAIFSMYGLTECKRCTWLPPGEIDRKPGSVGIAIPNTELWLVDDENKQIHEPHQIGQLVIRGATVMKGYWNKPEKTAEKLKPGLLPGEKVLYTGDYCTLDEDGYLYFKGRMDSMIKSRGIKVSPKEIEDFLHALPEVNAAVVTSVPSDEYGEALYAFVKVTQGKKLSESEIIATCKGKLEAYKVPEYVEIIQEMPKTPNGKFNILALKERAKSNILIS